jgi:uncharacterized protein (TIGR03067 family)
MKTPRAAALLVLVASSLGFAPAPFPKPERSQRDNPLDVNGTWEFVLWESNGTRSQSSESMYNIEMKRDQYVFAGKNGGGRTVYQMTLDPGASPRAFTWSMGNQVMYVGSYRLQKDEMTMIFATGNNVAMRPTDFNAKNVSYRFIMKRIRRG